MVALVKGIHHEGHEGSQRKPKGNDFSFVYLRVLCGFPIWVFLKILLRNCDQRTALESLERLFMGRHGFVRDPPFKRPGSESRSRHRSHEGPYRTPPWLAGERVPSVPAIRSSPSRNFAPRRRSGFLSCITAPNWISVIGWTCSSKTSSLSRLSPLRVSVPCIRAGDFLPQAQREIDWLADQLQRRGSQRRNQTLRERFVVEGRSKALTTEGTKVHKGRPFQVGLFLSVPSCPLW